jgi:hypothetical protein
MRFVLLAVVLLARPAFLAAQVAAPADVPLLVVLTDTGQVRDGLHVFAPHPAAARVSAALQRGFPARLVRLYRMEQSYLSRATGSSIEPAYLEFSRRQGGFPGFGFHLGAQAKSRAGYVDLYEPRDIRPRFGGVDQIFPHELAHVILRQLTGEPPRGGSTQGHAIGVRTDPLVAFDEGFAEHFQVMALDDPDVDPGTRALRDDPYWQARATRDAEAYREAMTARWAPAARARLAFMFWYSGDEQLWRYHSVKANAFARQTAVPARLLRRSDPYAAYLLENVLPASASDPPKTAAQMVATEGWVSTLFWRWATDDALRNRYRDEAFYAAFGVARGDVPPELNVYLKLFHALHAAKPHSAMAAVAAYRSVFPEDAADVDAIVRDLLLGQPWPSGPEIWLANPAYDVGTRVFDQYRAAPRAHSFDLNAASESDLVAVPGVDLELARSIRAHGPYATLAGLRGVAGVSDGLLQRFESMADAAARGQAPEEGADGLIGLLWSFGMRALAAWIGSAVAGAVLFKRVRRCGWPRAVASALAASFVTLVVAWLEGSIIWTAFAGLVVLGAPGLLLSVRQRPLLPALARTGLAWLSAVAPALVLVTPLF